jgi:hypothetical protein
MIGKKINQLATELAPASTDLTIIGDPISGVSKKITIAQLGAIFSGAVSFYDNFAAFPATGDINVIYCAKDTQKLYLWSGSAYVEVFPSQALLDTYQLRSEKGNANGYASLDSGGKVPISQLPSSIMEYKGTWNAATNTPTLANGTGDTGDVYICNVAGTVNFGAGPITFAVGDYVIYSGSIWQRSSGAVGTVTSVGLSTNGNSITIGSSPVTTSGTISANFVGNSTQYINGAGNLTTFPTLTGYVPYTGATANVDLGTFDLTADILTAATGSYTSSGGGNTLEISHSSGSGIALNITKGGNGEGLYINKTSGSGNAATIIGTLNATTLVKSGGTSSQFLKADGSVDSTAYGTGSVTSVAALTIGTTGTDLSSTVANSTTTPVITLNVPTASATNRGALSSADWTTFNNKQNTLTNPVTGTGTTNTLPKFTGASTIGNSALSDSGIALSYSNNIFLIGESDTSEKYVQFKSSTGSFELGTTSSAHFIFGVDSKPIYFYTNNNLKATLTAAGNLGIGTASPAQLLHVATSLPRIQIEAYVNTNNAGIQLKTKNSSGTVQTGGLYYNPGATPYISLTGDDNNLHLNVTSAGNVGIGTTSPGRRLSIESSDIWMSFKVTGNREYLIGQGTSDAFRIFDATADAERMRITSGGNVGIGTTEPNIYNFGGALFTLSSTTTYANIIIASSGTNSAGISLGNQGTRRAEIEAADGSNLIFKTNNANSGTAVTERMRITSGGSVVAGSTLATPTGGELGAWLWIPTQNRAYFSGTGGASAGFNRFTNTGDIVAFNYGGAGVGSISTNGTTTSYNITSDYRLKEDYKEINGLEKVNSIKVYDFKWKSINERMDGVIAHELQEVLPYAVQGIKNGKEMQSVDYSKIVPVLIKAIQEQQTQIEQLKNK